MSRTSGSWSPPRTAARASAPHCWRRPSNGLARPTCSKLELHVFPHNTGAIKLYEKFGFVQEGYRRAHYRRGDQFTDAILMAYML